MSRVSEAVLMLLTVALFGLPTARAHADEFSHDADKGQTMSAPPVRFVSDPKGPPLSALAGVYESDREPGKRIVIDERGQMKGEGVYARILPSRENGNFVDYQERKYSYEAPRRRPIKELTGQKWRWNATDNAFETHLQSLGANWGRLQIRPPDATGHLLIHIDADDGHYTHTLLRFHRVDPSKGQAGAGGAEKKGAASAESGTSSSSQNVPPEGGS